MAQKVVSTKLTEEEYGKLVGICSASGFTVSKLLKRAILARMNESPAKIEQVVKTSDQKIPKSTEPKKTKKSLPNSEDRYLYY